MLVVSSPLGVLWPCITPICDTANIRSEIWRDLGQKFRGASHVNQCTSAHELVNHVKHAG